MTRAEALELVDEALASHAAWLSLAAENAPAATMMIATRERDAARFKLVTALAPEPMPIRIVQQPVPPAEPPAPAS